jgi:ABC-type branched-subunit amino acid transport system ATPase component
MTEPLLSVTNVSVRFGGLAALRDVTFGVSAGEIFGIIGPNGAGKSTLLNVMSRLIRPTPGARIVFDGHELLGKRPHEVPRLGMGRTYQSIELSPTGTVLDNVLAGATIAYDSNLIWTFLGDFADRRRTADLTETTLAHLARLDILDFAHRPAADVPYAVKKRLQVCRAMMAAPKLLLLDEPASGMDAGEKRLLLDCLKRLHQTSGTTIVVIEHDVGFLASICDSMLALEFGKVLAVGPVAEVTSSPAVIAAYLGTED